MCGPVAIVDQMIWKLSSDKHWFPWIHGLCWAKHEILQNIFRSSRADDNKEDYRKKNNAACAGSTIASRTITIISMPMSCSKSPILLNAWKSDAWALKNRWHACSPDMRLKEFVRSMSARPLHDTEPVARCGSDIIQPRPARGQPSFFNQPVQRVKKARVVSEGGVN